jgi:hypothetical protein
MKFYKYNTVNSNWEYIIDNKLTATHCDHYAIRFYKNGKFHNSKNAAYIENNGYKEFALYDISFGCAFDFTKKSWRKFVRLQVFL